MGAAAILTTNPSDFANRQQNYFSRQHLKELIFNLRLGGFGTAKELPANSAASTIRFFRPRRAKKGTGTVGPRALVEGTAPTENTTVNIGYVDCTLKQRGDITSISDIVRGTDLFDTLQIYHKTMGADAALDFDFVCSHAIISSPGVADADGQPNAIPAGQATMFNSNSSYERFAGLQNPTLNSATDFASFAGLSNSAAKLTRAVHLGAVTRLKGVGGIPGVPMINGVYRAVVAPEVLSDMRQDSTWMTSATFNNNKGAGELDRWTEFTLDGAAFVETTSPFIETSGNYGIYSPDANGVIANNIYPCIYLGADAFGVPKLSGMRAGSDPRAPSIFVLDKPDKSDPLNQKTTIGWKAFYQAVLLKTNEATDVPHLVVLRVKSTFN